MTHYLPFEKLVALHVDLVCTKMGEPCLGVLSEERLEAALARPRHAAHYEGADLIRQAAYLFHGLIMNHGFVQGNKRTAYMSLEWFLHVNNVGRIQASDDAVIEMCLAVVEEQWDLERIEGWLVKHVVKV